MSTITIIQIILLSILIVFAIYYVFTEFFGNTYQPAIWKQNVKNGLISKRLLKAEKRYKDKDRFFNFWYQVERIKKDNIIGAFAELGVYKGITAEIIHLMDEGRDFYLFDTFEGFDESDLKVETGKAATYTTHNFADTSLEQVKARLTSSKFKFFKGNFSETIKTLADEKYALVSMDVDLYTPTKAGLEYFYPRLSQGGVIIVHDHNPDWPGIMKAVEEFRQKENPLIVPVIDTDNSIMIFKN